MIVLDQRCQSLTGLLLGDHMFKVKAIYDENGKRIGWGVFEGDKDTWDVWPTKAQATAAAQQARGN